METDYLRAEATWQQRRDRTEGHKEKDRNKTWKPRCVLTHMLYHVILLIIPGFWLAPTVEHWRMFVWALWMFGSMFKTADQSVCIPLSASLSHHLVESPHQGQCDITRLFYRAHHIMEATLTTWRAGWTQRLPDLYLTVAQRTRGSLLTYRWYSRRKHMKKESGRQVMWDLVKCGGWSKAGTRPV